MAANEAREHSKRARERDKSSEEMLDEAEERQKTKNETVSKYLFT